MDREKLAEQWFLELERQAKEFSISPDRAIMEVRARLLDEVSVGLDLLETAHRSEVHTFGWPIAVVLLNRSELKPQPTSTGIIARVYDPRRGSVDFWSWHEAGSFYLYKTIFEDERKKGSIFFDTRIIRITETLMYLRNFYNERNVSPSTRVSIQIKHSGIKDRLLESANPSRFLFGEYKCTEENECAVVMQATINDLNIDQQLVGLVKEVTQKLFRLFGFFSLQDHVLEDIAGNYLKGKIV